MLRPVLVAALLLPLAACETEPERPAPRSIPFEIDGTLTFSRDGRELATIAIETADTDSTRARGLMERREIPDDTGMLFIFPTEEVQGFYMANTPSSLDIIFVGADSLVTNVEANTVPFQVSPTYNSDGPTQYVVEVPAGYAQRHGITAGTRIDWSREGDAAADAAPPADTLGADA